MGLVYLGARVTLFRYMDFHHSINMSKQILSKLLNHTLEYIIRNNQMVFRLFTGKIFLRPEYGYKTFNRYAVTC